MKIHEVSLRTGLTEKAIRLYIQNGLIHPHVEEGFHRNSYTFSETNVKELEEIAIFRRAGFSLFEISLIKEMPEKLPELLNTKMQSLEIEIAEKQNIQEAISRLEVHELANATHVANSLRPALKKENETEKGRSRRPIYICVILLILLVFLFYAYTKAGWFAVSILLDFICFLIGLISCVMTIRYATAQRRANKLSNIGKGTIVSVVEEHGFDIGYTAGRGTAGTKEPGIGGIWQIVFMLWNEIRPDCWYPVILYLTEDGTKESATLAYGSFKNTWTTGEEIDIAWDEANTAIVYPMSKHWISKKVYFYTLISCVAFTLCTLCLLFLF